MAKKNVRSLALQLLLRIENAGSFSHLLLSDAIRKEGLDPQDEKLLTEIVYGTIERKLTLDYYLQPFIRSPKKVSDWVMTLLRMSVFQLKFLDRVPNYAAIDEAVEIAKQKGHRGIASFVNGVLRNLLRKGIPKTEEITDPVKRLSIETSHPEWLVKRWVKQYGFETAKQICEANVLKKPVTLRINQMKTNRVEVIRTLEQVGIEAVSSPFVKDGVIIQKGNVLKTDLIEEGLVTVQDQSSMLAVTLLQADKNMKILDACSAPGGKATYIGEIMRNTGTVYAHDLHQKKIKLVENNAKRLGLGNVQIEQTDARKLQSIYEKESFDRILVDAPCSGLGVIRSKPDIKYNKRVQDIYTLHDIQLAILNHVAPLLKKDGKLVYSTCTMDVQENEEVVRDFLEKHNNFIVDESFMEEVKDVAKTASLTKYGLQLFPHSIQSDGFFMVRFVKTET